VKLSQVIGRIDIEGKSNSLHYRRVQTESSRAVQVPRETIRSEREIEGHRRIEAQTIGSLPVAVRLRDESAEFLPHWADSPAPVPEFVFDQRLGW